MATKAAIKKGKKKWFEIYAPKEFREQIIGESPAYEVSELKGRNITVDASKIADSKKSNVKLIFKVTDVKDKGAFTELVGYEIPQSSIKRSVRVNSSKVADSFKLKTSDGVDVVLKPVIITKGKTVNSVLTTIRKQLKEGLTKFVHETKYSELMMEVIRGKVQFNIKNSLKKTYPVTFCDFSKIKRGV
ncbi:MAG: hypothetical protein PHT54_01715 [Candidatus Nanoarchaeia archaeon]|nr:hypothetical protein [Candidatus Nanoarchaeia archaeon]